MPFVAPAQSVSPSDVPKRAGLTVGWVGRATMFLFPSTWRSSSRALWHWVTPQSTVSYSFSWLVKAALSSNDPFVCWFLFREVSLIPLSWFCVPGTALACCRRSRSSFTKFLFRAACGDAWMLVALFLSVLRSFDCVSLQEKGVGGGCEFHCIIHLYNGFHHSPM